MNPVCVDCLHLWAEHGNDGCQLGDCRCTEPRPIDERGEWLAWRRTGLGASDAAAVLGISPWKSRWALYAEKVGLVTDDEDSEAMESGRMLEPAIAPWFTARTGLYVAGEQMRATHPELPHFRATLDGIVGDGPNVSLDAALGGLEIKVSSESAKTWEDHGVPAHYEAQAQFQMLVTGMERTWFAVLHTNFGARLRVYELARNEADIALIREACERFWTEHVVAGVPPELDGSESTSRALAAAYPGRDEDAIDLPDSVATDLDYLAILDSEAKRLAEEIDLRKNRLRGALGEHRDGLVGGALRVSWRPQARTSIDTKALRATHPDIADEFTTTTEMRVLRTHTPKERKSA